MSLPEIRNARLIRDGVIECEILHPSLGWIPYGAVSGADGQPGQVYAAAIATAVDARDPVDVLAEERATMWASRFQARAALRVRGLFDAADAAIRASGDPILIEAWDSADGFSRLSPNIIRVSAALNLLDEQVDDLFRFAATLSPRGADAD